MVEQTCPECHNARTDFTKVCPKCGAPPITEHRTERPEERPVRTNDLEPYVALRYIARLFKVLAILMLIAMSAEIVTGLLTDGRAAIPGLLAAATRLLVLAALMWAGGDLTMLLIDLGHDVRVSRILLGRINAELHRPKEGSPAQTPPSTERRAGT